jgi:hypothetical protein
MHPLRVSLFVSAALCATLLVAGSSPGIAAPPPPLSPQPNPVKCAAPDVPVYADVLLKVYYTADQAGYTAKPDQGGYVCKSVAVANGYPQGLNAIPVKGPNGVTFTVYPSIADAQKAAPAGCGGSTSPTAFQANTIVYIWSGAAFRLDDPSVGKGLNTYTCWSEASKGGLKMSMTFAKDPATVQCAGAFNPVVYVDNVTGQAEYYESKQAGFKSKPGTGGYGCEAEAKELGYNQHRELLATSAKTAAAVHCVAPDQVIFYGATDLGIYPIDRAVSTDYGAFACLSDAKAHGFTLVITTIAGGAGVAELKPGTDDKALHIACDNDGAWFTPAPAATQYMRQTNPNYAAGSGFYSCGRYGTLLGAKPATPGDVAIPPPFSCNQIAQNAPPKNWLQISYAASTPLTCSYNLDVATLDPNPSSACGAPPNAYTITYSGKKDVLRVALMTHADFRLGSAGTARGNVAGPVATLCLLGKALASPH